MGSMADRAQRTLFELAGRDGVRFSPYCWRIRYALAHKGLAARREPVLFTDKSPIAPSGHDRLPVLDDGGTWIGDSWRIACHLEERYPERALFAHGRTHARFVNAWADGALHPLILRAIVAELVERVHPRDREYFRSSRERRLGAPLTRLAERRGEYRERLLAALAPLEAALAESPFLDGERPAYCDYVVAGTMEWIGRGSTLAVPAPGTRLAGWFARVRSERPEARD